MSNDEAALAAHRIILAHLVAEAHHRLGDDASAFLGQIRRVAVASVENAEGEDEEADLRPIKQLIINAIEAVFR